MGSQFRKAAVLCASECFNETWASGQGREMHDGVEALECSLRDRLLGRVQRRAEPLRGSRESVSVCEGPTTDRCSKASHIVPFPLPRHVMRDCEGRCGLKRGRGRSRGRDGRSSLRVPVSRLTMLPLQQSQPRLATTRNGVMAICARLKGRNEQSDGQGSIESAIQRAETAGIGPTPTGAFCRLWPYSSALWTAVPGSSYSKRAAE